MPGLPTQLTGTCSHTIGQPHVLETGPPNGSRILPVLFNSTAMCSSKPPPALVWMTDGKLPSPGSTCCSSHTPAILSSLEVRVVLSTGKWEHVIAIFKFLQRPLFPPSSLGESPKAAEPSRRFSLCFSLIYRAPASLASFLPQIMLCPSHCRAFALLFPPPARDALSDSS